MVAAVGAIKRVFKAILTVVGLARDQTKPEDATSPEGSGMNGEKRARIANRAHDLWLLAGCPEGRPEEHWRQAEAEIEAERHAPRAPGRMPEDVRAALANAVLARSFALERGQDVGEEVIVTLADARQELYQNSWTKEKEVAFWQCYLKLNSILSPITIETIKAIRQEVRTSTWSGALSQKLGRRIFHSTSPATIATRQYRVWGIAALILVLFLQVYYAMGSSLLREREELKRAELVYHAANDPGLADDPQILVEREKLLKASTERLQREQNITNAGEAGAVLAKTVRLVSLEMDIKANSHMIEGINHLNLLWLVLGPDLQEEQYADSMAYSYLRLTMDSIAIYFLPLLYGLLGACAYIIRTVSVEIQQVRYSQETHTRFELRLFLGALAGLAVVWFIKPDDPHITIPTVALAFLAGYSVELVFVAMDRLVAAFGGEPQSQPPGIGTQASNMGTEKGVKK
jgi:hypothetical protein